MNNDRRILVTGGTKGLGLQCVRQLSLNGFEVIATGRSLSDELKNELSSRIHFYPLDLTHPHEIRERIKILIKDWNPIWGLVNNAAVGHDGILATMHESDIINVLNINLTSTIIVTKYIVRSMLSSGSGRIINIASIIATTGFNGLSVYAASKAGLVGFTKSLARELGRVGITVNCISPGYMETDMTASLDAQKLDTIRRRSPLGQLVKTSDAANMVSFLMSDQADLITGSNFVVDAGSTA